MKNNLFEILKGEKNSIPYRPEIAREIGVISSIILQQMIYRYNGEKFYKFTEKSNNEKYRKGDSWTEELGLTKFEFTNNLKKIAFKLGKTKNEITKEEALIIYYTDSNRITWYDLNLDNVNNLLSKCYNLNYLVNKETGFTKINKETGFINSIQDNNTNNNTNIKETKVSDNISSYKGKSYKTIDNYLLDEVKIELDKIINSWNNIFKEKRRITPDLLEEYKKVRKKYSKEDIMTGLNGYIKTKEGIKDKKYLLSPLAFFKQRNGLVNYL